MAESKRGIQWREKKQLWAGNRSFNCCEKAIPYVKCKKYILSFMLAVNRHAQMTPANGGKKRRRHHIRPVQFTVSLVASFLRRGLLCRLTRIFTEFPEWVGRYTSQLTRLIEMIHGSTEEGTAGGGHTWAATPTGRGGLNETTSCGPRSTSSASSQHGLDGGSASCSRGPASARPPGATGDLMGTVGFSSFSLLGGLGGL